MNLPDVALTPLKQAAAVGSRAGEEDEGLAPKAKQIKAIGYSSQPEGPIAEDQTYMYHQTQRR